MHAVFELLEHSVVDELERKGCHNVNIYNVIQYIYFILLIIITIILIIIIMMPLFMRLWLFVSFLLQSFKAGLLYKSGLMLVFHMMFAPPDNAPRHQA